MQPCHAASGRRDWEGEHPPNRDWSNTSVAPAESGSPTKNPECPKNLAFTSVEVSLHAVGFRSITIHRSLLGISETDQERRQARPTVTAVTQVSQVRKLLCASGRQK